MLQPANRLTLIDAMRPPAGFRFDSAMAVTYTLDLRALLAAPTALALAGSGRSALGTSAGADEGSDGSSPDLPDRRVKDEASTPGEHDRYEPIELLHALRAHAGKLTVFSQAGEIALPPSRRVFAFVEQAVVPVAAPLGGIVHPKVWVLRYQAADEPKGGHPLGQRLRVLIASRNLTFDASWDTVVRLDETTDVAGVRLTAVGPLFEGLLDCTIGGPTADHRERVLSLAEALQDATFALPEGVDDLRVHVLGLAATPFPLPRDVERSLIISPFLSDDFFTRVHPFQIDELVSRPEQLDRLDEDLLPDSSTSDSAAKVRYVYAFDDGSTPDFDVDDDKLSHFDPGRPLVGLHAKIFAFEEHGRARLFVGSANATGRAFANNVEVLAELIGPIDALGIDRLCSGIDDEPREPGLRELFCPYRRGELPESSAETSLDRWRQAIAQLSYQGQVTENADGWTLTYWTDEPVPEPDDVTIHCWPLTVVGNRRRVAPGKPLNERFKTSLKNLSGFLAFELVHVEGELSRFVVPVPLAGVPERRGQDLLRYLIGNEERFFRYLMALLEEDAGESSLIDAIERLSGSDQGRGDEPIRPPVLERLLRTMRRDPGKLAGIHPLVSDLADDDALPLGFAELWEMILQVAITERPAR